MLLYQDKAIASQIEVNEITDHHCSKHRRYFWQINSYLIIYHY